MPYKYIGRTTSYKGKTLWEIVGNLKNFGVGRIVTRSVFERYPEPTFMKVIKVETLPEAKDKSPDNVRKVRVTVEKTFRGEKLPKLIKIDSSSYKADYKLIPRDDEVTYMKVEPTKSEIKILPRTMAFPPLMREMLMRDMKIAGQEVKEPVMEIAYNKHIVKGKKSNCRIANEGEKPTVMVNVGLGIPVAPRLYEGIKL